MPRSCIALALLVGCTTSDPELDPWAEVLRRADLVQQSDVLPADALTHTRAARALRDLPSLAAVEARLVLAESGVADALVVLDGALERFPRDAGLRWDRAALRARSGDLVGAAKDLRGPVGRGELDPARLGRDPDLAAVATDAMLAGLVRLPEVSARVDAAPDGIVGESWTLEMEVRAPKQPLQIVGAGPQPIARIERVVEDVLDEDDWDSTRRITWSARLVGPSEGRVGPWELRAGGASGGVSAVPLEATLLGEPVGLQSRWPTELWVPEALLGDEVPPAVVRRGAYTLVAAPAHMEVQTTGCVSVESRRRGQRRWAGAVCDSGSGAAWTIKDGAVTVLQGKL